MASTHRRDRRIPVSSTVQIHALANQMASQDLWTRKCGPVVDQRSTNHWSTSHVHGWWPAMYMVGGQPCTCTGPAMVPAMVQAQPWSRPGPGPGQGPDPWPRPQIPLFWAIWAILDRPGPVLSRSDPICTTFILKMACFDQF